MTTPIATAYVDILPNTANFTASLTRQVDESLGSVKAKAKETGAALGDRVHSGTARAEHDMGHFREVGVDALHEITKAVGALVAFEGLKKLGEGFLGAGEQIEHLEDRIRVGTGASGEDLEHLVEAAKKIGAEVPNSFADIGDAVTLVSQRLDLTGKPLEDMAEKFLNISRVTKEQLSIPETTKALAAFGVAAKDQGSTLEQLFATSQRTGVTMSTLVAGLASGAPVLTQFGFDAARSANLLGSLDKAGVSADKVTTGLRIAFAKFAKAGVDPQKALLSNVAAMQKFIAAGNVPGAGAIAAKVFGTRGAAAFTAAVKSGALSVASLSADAEKVGHPIETAAKNTLHFGEQMAILRNQITEAVGPKAAQVLEFLSGQVKKLQAAFASPEFAAFAHQVGAVVGPVLSAVGAALADNVPKLKDFAESFARAAHVIAENFLPPIGVVVAVFVGSLGPAISGVLSALTAVTDFISAHADTFGLFAAVLGGIAAGMLAVRAGAVAMAAGEAIASAATALLSGGTFTLAAAMAATGIPEVVIGLAALAAGLIYAWKKSETFRVVVVTAFNAVKDAAATVAQFLIGNWLRTFDLIISGAAKAFGWIPGIGGKLQAANAAFDAFSNGVNNALQSIKDKDIRVTINQGHKMTKEELLAAQEAGRGKLIGPITGPESSRPRVDDIPRITVPKIPIPSLGTGIGLGGGGGAAAKDAAKKAAADAAKAAAAAAKAAAAAVARALKAVRTEITARTFVDSITGGQEKIKSQFDKLLTNLKAANQPKLAAYAASVEKALLRVAGRRDAVAEILKTRRERLADLRKESDDFATSIRESIAATGDLTKVTLADATSTADGGLDAARALAGQMAELNRVGLNKSAFASLFGASQGAGTAATAAKSNFQRIREAMAAALKQAQEFSARITALTRAGLNKDVLRQLLAAGPEAGNATAKAIQEGGAAGIAKLNELQTKLNDAGKSLGASTADTFYAAGIKTAEGIVKGLQSKEAAIIKAMDKIADALVARLKKKLKIHSPSAVAVELFTQVGAGAVAGLTASIAPVLAAGGQVAAAAVPTSAPAMAPIRLSAPTEAPAFDVRVFIGDTELTHMVRTEISRKDRALRRSVLAGRPG